MGRLNVAYMPLKDLMPRAKNPRTHTANQITQIANSIEAFGFTNPVLIDDEDKIIAGHGRALAAEKLGMDEVPTIRLSDMSEAEIRAYVIADNKIAENAGWDEQLLGLELEYLTDPETELSFDVSLTGFDVPEIDLLIQNRDGATTTSDEPPIPEIVDGTTATQIGDVWQCGPHRLICGDATQPAVYEALLSGEKAQMVFSDPPYNVPISGHVGGKGAIQHREFPMASGEMSSGTFKGFLQGVFDNLSAHSVDGSIHFQCMDWRHMSEILAAGQAAYTELKNVCVWTKSNGGMGSLYRSQHEFVFVFKAGSGAHINNVELGRHGRNRTNVWPYTGATSFGAARDKLALHPTVKPLQLVEDAILDCSHRGSIILDAFVGAGTTLLAAHQTGRRGFGIELDPHYCDVALKRLHELTGIEPVHVATGQALSERQAFLANIAANDQPYANTRAV